MNSVLSNRFLLAQPIDLVPMLKQVLQEFLWVNFVGERNPLLRGACKDKYPPVAEDLSNEGCVPECQIK
ncbi:hypothetical protein DYD21_20350 [Rhodohalobacter sp. SW132]|nr:hypothetical protein DYD21_20350 [Rhodohalobacter sp. SW132]